MNTCKLDHAILPIQRDAFLHASCAPKASSGAVCSYVPVPRIDLHTTSSRDDLYIVCNLNKISQSTAHFSLSFRPTLAPFAIPKLSIQIKTNILMQLDSNTQPCSKLHVFGNTRPVIQLYSIQTRPIYYKISILCGASR